jgi:hypothetical protein
MYYGFEGGLRLGDRLRIRSGEADGVVFENRRGADIQACPGKVGTGFPIRALPKKLREHRKRRKLRRA